MNFSIQQLSIDNSAEVTEMITSSLKQDFPYKKKTIAEYCKIYNKSYFTKLVRSKKNVIFGASEEDKLIGIISVKTEYGGVMYIDWVVIKREFRGKGLGTILLEKAEEWALAHKLHYEYLFTETDKNIEFYKKRGFRFVGTHFNSWFGETEHVLGKTLRDKPFE
jgi:ribosomal protein S18 acetylase RimI-like enzyme